MMSYSNLEKQFVDYYREIEQAVFMNEYSRAMEIIKKAMEVCKRLYEEATDFRKKQKYDNNAKALQKIWTDCKAKVIELEGSYTPVVKPTPLPKQPTRKSSPTKMNNNESPDSNPVEMPKYDPEDMIVDNVDISSILILEANDDVDFDNLLGMETEKRIIAKELFPTPKQLAAKNYTGQKSKNFILLYGVPGTGKTFFAKAVSNELKKRFNGEVPFFAINTAALKDCKVGQTEKNITALFKFCEKFEKCVLFFDEFDLLVPDRSKDNGDPTAHVRTEEFLKATDGFSSAKNILIIAATNFPENIDNALKDRMSLKLEVPVPEKAAIFKMIKDPVSQLIDDPSKIDLIADKLIGCSCRAIKRFISIIQDYWETAYEESEYQLEEITKFKINYEKVALIAATTIERVNPKDIERIKRYKNSISNI